VSAPADKPIRRWPLYLLIPIAGFGAFVAVLMTGHHERELYGDEAQQAEELVGCEESATVNCDIVNTSEYSEIFGVPIATFAIPTYVLVIVLAIAALRGRREALWMLLAIGAGAVLYSMFLFYISATELGYYCAWCLRLYAVNLSIPVLAWIARARPKPWPAWRPLAMAAGAFVVVAGVAIGSQRAYRASLLGEATDTALARHEAAAAPVEEERDPRDPEGPAPAREIRITNEAGQPATLVLRPEDAWIGNPEAAVTVVEFADLQCGYCKRASAQMERLIAAYSDRVLFVFKHYPMDPACNSGVQNRRHPRACVAARAAVCAQRQRRFWEFSRVTFKNQHALDADTLRTYAQRAGVEDLSAFDACMADPASAQAVSSSAADGAALSIRGTPRIFIQGMLYRSGSSAEQMARAIELALGRNAEEAAAAAREIREAGEAPITEIPADVPAMRAISHGNASFSIQTFEASLSEQGHVESGRHLIPATDMSWYAARDACAAVGMRLCTEREWVTACQGAEAVDDDGDGETADDMVEGTSYPYGDYHDVQRCWDGREGEQFRPVYTAEMPGCVSPDGVYDLTGNVEEWAGATEDEAVLLGGAWDTTDDHARCYRRNDSFGPGYANRRTGFRCCADR
jgi:protein-disulfide isomerase/uncharacterized membrane protein